MASTLTFFSVDVETTTTSPHTGHLLTVGIQPVQIFDENYANPIISAESLYLRIDRTAYYADWYADLHDPNSTLSWWLRQNSTAQAEGFRDLDLERISGTEAASLITRYVELVEPSYWHRVFTANPVSFDYPWIDALYVEAGAVDPSIRNPFPHRTLCLRSMRFGLNPTQTWKPERDYHDPEIPHHALYDAQAQARDLVMILRERAGLETELIIPDAETKEV